MNRTQRGTMTEIEVNNFGHKSIQQTKSLNANA